LATDEAGEGHVHIPAVAGIDGCGPDGDAVDEDLDARRCHVVGGAVHVGEAVLEVLVDRRWGGDLGPHDEGWGGIARRLSDGRGRRREGVPGGEDGRAAGEPGTVVSD